MMIGRVTAAALLVLTVVLTFAPAQADYGYTTLNYPGLTDDTAYGINNAGQIVGRYEDNSGNYYGFLLSGSTWTSLAYPGVNNAPYGNWTVASGINNAGQVVGEYDSLSKGGLQAFLYNGSAYTTLSYPGVTVDGAYGINDAGQIVGDGGPTGTLLSGILLGSTWASVNYPGGVLTNTLGINDAGQVVGDYTDANGHFHGFLLRRIFGDVVSQCELLAVPLS